MGEAGSGGVGATIGEACLELGRGSSTDDDFGLRNNFDRAAASKRGYASETEYNEGRPDRGLLGMGKGIWWLQGVVRPAGLML